MKPIKKLFIDTETTGTNYKLHCIHQIGGIIEIDDKIVHRFDFKLAPHPKAKIDQDALKVGRVTEEIIRSYPDQALVFAQFKAMLSDYIDPYDKTDKMYLIGYNNRGFDDFFIRMLFELNGDQFIGSYFWNDTIDALVLASQYLIGRRPNMPNFRLATVAKELGIFVDENNTHGAPYDAEITRKLYRIVTGLDFEI